MSKDTINMDAREKQLLLEASQTTMRHMVLASRAAKGDNVEAVAFIGSIVSSIVPAYFKRIGMPMKEALEVLAGTWDNVELEQPKRNTDA